MLDTVVTFTRDWAFNSSIHGPLHSLLDSQWLASVVGESMAKPLSSKWLINGVIWTALLSIMIVTLRCGVDLWQAVLVYLFASLLLSSTVYPWYLLWALAFVPIRFNIAVWVWSVTIVLSYIVWLDPDPWQVPMWALIAQDAPVYAVLVWMGWHRPRTGKPEINKHCTLPEPATYTQR